MEKDKQEKIESKISAIKKYLRELDNYQEVSADDIREIGQVRGAVERYLQLAVQSTIDLAETVIAYKKLRKPSTLSESFDILREGKIIDDKLSEQLINIAGFRNIIIYQYREVDEEIMINILKNNLGDIEGFIKIIERKIINEQ